MNKYKYLVKNIGILTLSNFSSKVISFLLVPLYTHALSAYEYGVFDIINTTVLMLVPILTVDVQEAVLRFALDDKVHEKQKVLCVGLKYVYVGTLCIFFFLIINYYFSIFSILKIYGGELLFFYFLSSYNSIITYYARGIEKIKDLGISSVLATVTILATNVLFLIVFKWGLKGYFWATILGLLVQNTSLSFKLCNYHIFFNCLRVNIDIQRQMTKYSKPMIVNSVSWWINTASDRYIVTYICGVAANGVYSISYKIPSIISMLQAIFGQAWTISVVKGYNETDRDVFIKKIYIVYNYFLCSFCSVLILFDQLIAKILFDSTYYEAWKYAPYLILSTVFAGISTMIGGLFSATKETIFFSKTSIISAIINIIGNMIFVYVIGPMGAAVSTLISYFIMWIMRIFIIKKYMEIQLGESKDIYIYILLLLQCVIMIFNQNIVSKYIMEIGLTLFVLFLCWPAFAIVFKSLDLKKYIKK